MKLGVLVNEGPFTHQASDSAYHFVKAAIEKGYNVDSKDIAEGILKNLLHES